MSIYEIGPAERPVDLVFSHANGFNARTYLSILATVAETRRIVAPDLRGRGRSNALPGPYGMAAHADDVAAVIGALAAGPAVVEGWTVLHDRDAGPSGVVAYVTTSERQRVVVRRDDAALAAELSGGQLVGRTVTVVASGEGTAGFDVG